MTGLGIFQSSVLGMSSHTHALDVISANIANMTTGAYKRTDTSFQTVLAGSVTFRQGGSADTGASSWQADLGGARASDAVRISKAGEYKSSDRDLDLAVIGRGFLVLSGQTGSASGSDSGLVYGRDGRLFIKTVGADTVPGADGTPISVPRGYLVDKNGYFVQGWAANADGSFDETAPTTAMRVDANAFKSVGQPTTQVQLGMNLPADDDPGAVESTSIDVYDSAATQRGLRLGFTKAASPLNTWELDVTSDAGDVVQVEPQTNGTPTPLTFGSDGRLTGGGTYTVSVTFADQQTATFNLDLSGFTQWSGNMVEYDYQRDGYANGALTGIHVDGKGDVIGSFDNGHERPLYRLALADFTNPDGLDVLSGNVYAQSSASGAAEIAAAGQGGLGDVRANTLETSNVDLATEFSNMILTQNAYNSSATAFKTIDEMMQTAAQLKSS